MRGLFAPNLVKKTVHGGLLGKRVKYNFLCDFLFISLFFFSDQRREETLDGFWRLMAKRRGIVQGCAFLRLRYLILTWDPIYPQNVKFWPQKFQAKMMKHESPSISESAKPMDLKIWNNVKNVK